MWRGGFGGGGRMGVIWPLLRNTKVLQHEEVVRPWKCSPDNIPTHWNTLRFDAAEARAFWVGGQVIWGVVICAWKCEVCVQAWGLCPSLGTQDRDQTKCFKRGAVFTELCVVEDTGREWQVINASWHLPTISKTAVTDFTLPFGRFIVDHLLFKDNQLCDCWLLCCIRTTYSGLSEFVVICSVYKC